MHLLCAEDNLSNEFVIGKFLAVLGHTYEFVPDGLQVVERARSGEFDAILMDVHLPELDGIAATLKIREDEASNSRARVPIIAVTASATHGDPKNCLSAGMDYHLAKPLRIPQIEEALKTVCTAK